jgi:hypothetical protein
MKTALTLAAACVLTFPAAGLAQTYTHGGGGYHAGARPSASAPEAHASVPNGRGNGQAGRTYAANTGYRSSGVVGRSGYRGGYGGDYRRDGRYGGAAFGLGVLTGAVVAGGYDGGYGHAGYPAYVGGDYAYAPDAGYYAPDAYAPDDGSGYAYQTNDPSYLAGGYGQAPVQDYAQPGYPQPDYAQPGYAQPGYSQPDYAQSSQTQIYQGPPAQAYGDAGYSQGYAGGPACGHWAWDAPIGRYVWAC